MSKERHPIVGVNSKIALWEQGTDVDHTIDRELMHKNLLDFKRIAEKHNLTFTLILGTLLGVIRDKELIAWDDDVDLGVFTETPGGFTDYYKFGYVLDDLEREGFHVPDRRYCPWHWITFVRDGQKIDLWMFQKIDNERIYTQVVRYPTHYFDTLDEVEWLGTTWKTPHNAESWLEYQYGKNWKKG